MHFSKNNIIEQLLWKFNGQRNENRRMKREWNTRRFTTPCKRIREKLIFNKEKQINLMKRWSHSSLFFANLFIVSYPCRKNLCFSITRLVFSQSVKFIFLFIEEKAELHLLDYIHYWIIIHLLRHNKCITNIMKREINEAKKKKRTTDKHKYGKYRVEIVSIKL